MCEEKGYEPESDIPTPEEHLLASELKIAIAKGMEQLTEKQKIIVYKTLDLINFDTCGMKPYLESKCEKRIEWKGVCKGENGLSSMSDKDVVEKASEAKNGEKFKRLYAGDDLQNNHSNSDMSLMNILAYWCNGDKEQMLRIFATSGLFRPNKSADYYEHTAIKALREIPVKSTYTPIIPKNTGGNGKR